MKTEYKPMYIFSTIPDKLLNDEFVYYPHVIQLVACVAKEI